MHAWFYYIYIPAAIVADAMEPHNGGLVPPLGPHHVRPPVLHTPPTSPACTHTSMARAAGLARLVIARERHKLARIGRARKNAAHRPEELPP